MSIPVELQRVMNWFKFHPPRDDSVIELHSTTREMASEFAEWIFDNVPESPERSIALEKVRESMMWANAAIACNQGR